ncbi:MAG: AI-2E family transporter [Lachnospiraceae bacterium]|nr:AI-2E family transporter [Lachnospiraceae bacterium]
MKSDKKRYLQIGLTIFASLAAVVAFYFIVLRYQGLKTYLDIVLLALQPVMVGIVIAYVLCPVARFLERQFRRGKRLSRAARPLSVLFTLIFAIGILGLFCALILPQVVDSIRSLVVDLPGMLEVQLTRLESYLETDSDAAATAMQMIASVETFLMTWIKENLFAAVSNVAVSVLSIGSAIVNLVVSIVVTVYLLLDRERYLGQCKKLFYAVSRNKRFNCVVMEVVHQADQIFSGFISGKLLDSLIVGIICFVCLTVLKMPYALLVSVIVGVTNIIPMFGPFIGAIPSAFLILLVSPSKCIIFLIFIVILQQLDGNIIGPRILGNSTGLSALYVTVAMLLFGKLMGFVGMIVGVPLFATLYYIVKRLAEYSLKRQGMPVSTAEYAGTGGDAKAEEEQGSEAE